MHNSLGESNTGLVRKRSNRIFRRSGQISPIAEDYAIVLDTKTPTLAQSKKAHAGRQPKLPETICFL